MAGSAVTTANNSVIDVRGVQAPDNVLMILHKVVGLGKGATLEVCLDSNPFQLYDLLQQRGFFLNLVLQEDGSYRGVLKRRDVDALSH
jgi:TusA-related sulfurtransferase